MQPTRPPGPSASRATARAPRGPRPRPTEQPSRAPGAGAASRARIQVHGRIGWSFLSRLAAMELTWLGHSTFRLDAEGKRVYIDPFLNGNPKCPEAEQTPEHVAVIAITHAHG